MKAILMSIKPKWVAKILNGEKTIEIRKKFPKDYVGWVYIYCTKSKPYITGIYNHENKIVYGDIGNKRHNINGKVVARFWCDKVEEIKELYEQGETMYDWNEYLKVSSMTYKEFLDKSCLSERELHDYLKYLEYEKDIYGYAIHITKLEIFDKPKEISEFMKVSCKGCPFENTQTCHNDITGRYCRLTRAPQSWCYVEV